MSSAHYEIFAYGPLPHHSHIIHADQRLSVLSSNCSDIININ